MLVLGVSNFLFSGVPGTPYNLGAYRGLLGREEI